MTTTTPGLTGHLKSSYFQQAKAIIERANNNKRRLSIHDLKQLKELHRAIKDLNKVVMPEDSAEKLRLLREAVDAQRAAFAAQELDKT